MEKFWNCLSFGEQTWCAGEHVPHSQKQYYGLRYLMFIDFARVHVNDAQKALELLQKHGYQVELRQALRVILPNKRGQSDGARQKNRQRRRNIDYLYCALQEPKRGTVILEVDLQPGFYEAVSKPRILILLQFQQPLI